MGRELKAYIRQEAFIAGAFSFFISGMIAALIYHKADRVPTDTVCIATDLLVTCLLTFCITAPLCRASLRRMKTYGILPMKNGSARLMGRLFGHILFFGAATGLMSAIVLFALIAPIFALLRVNAVPFAAYIVMKSIFCALLGGTATITGLYAGLCAPQ